MEFEASLPPVVVVQRSKQRLIRIRIEMDRISLSGPSSVSKKELYNFFTEKEAWVKKSYQQLLERKRQLIQKKEKEKGALLLRGRLLPISHVPVPGLKKNAIKEQDERIVYCYNPDSAQKRPSLSLKKGLPPALMYHFYRKIANIEIPERCRYWDDRLPWQPDKVVIRNQKTKWGSCSRRKTISLNWRLIKCPQTILDYIIVHEYCHLKYFNHSKAFWDEVTRYYPETNYAKRWIKEHSEALFFDF